MSYAQWERAGFGCRHLHKMQYRARLIKGTIRHNTTEGVSLIYALASPMSTSSCMWGKYLHLVWAFPHGFPEEGLGIAASLDFRQYQISLFGSQSDLEPTHTHFIGRPVLLGALWVTSGKAEKGKTNTSMDRLLCIHVTPLPSVQKVKPGISQNNIATN